MSEIEDPESDFRSRMSYGDYLRLSELLGAQSPLTDAHDELLFIIQHQTSELWMKLAIREIRAACTLIRADGDAAQPSNCSRASRGKSSSSSTVHGTSCAP